MIKQIVNIFSKLDKKIINVMKNGLIFSFIISILSMILLISYLFFIHTNLLYQIGLLVFQLSLYFAIDFIISGIVVDTIRTQIM